MPSASEPDPTAARISHLAATKSQRNSALLAADSPPAPADLRAALRTIDRHVDGYIDHAHLGNAA